MASDARAHLSCRVAGRGGIWLASRRRKPEAVEAWRIVPGRFLSRRARATASGRDTREQNRDEPGRDERKPDDPENAAGVFARADSAKPTGRKPAAVTRVPVSMGKPSRSGIGRGACPVPALFHLHHHHFNGDDGVIDEQPSAMMRAPSVMRWRSIPAAYDQQDDRQDQWHRKRHHDACAPASDRKLTTSTMTRASARSSRIPRPIPRRCEVGSRSASPRFRPEARRRYRPWYA